VTQDDTFAPREGVVHLRTRLAARILLPAAIAVGAVLATAASAWAYVSPGCHAAATDSNGQAVPSSIRIDDTNVWNVSKDSKLSGTGTAATEQTFGSANAVLFGLGVIPIASGRGRGQRGSGSVDVSAYADKVRVISVAGASDSCNGYLTVVVRDESALDTLAGRVAAGAAALGAIGVFGVALRRRPS